MRRVPQHHHRWQQHEVLLACCPENFSNNIFKWIFLTENAWILIRITLSFVTKSLTDNKLALVQVMAWQQTGTKPLSEPMMTYCQLDSKEQTSVNFQSNTTIFIQENAFENAVHEMAAILSRPQCVNIILN